MPSTIMPPRQAGAVFLPRPQGAACLPRRFVAAVAAAATLSGVALPCVAATVTVTTTAAVKVQDGYCSLREAVYSINAGLNAYGCVATGSAYGTNDTIEFNIDGATDAGCTGANGVCTIRPTTAADLDLIKPTVVDGTTQPGSQINSRTGMAYPGAQGLNTRIRIEIDGSLVPSNAQSTVMLRGTGASILRGVAI